MTDTHKLRSTTHRTDNGDGTIEPAVGSSSASREFHAVRFYESDASLARIVAEFLHAGVDDGSPGIVVATPDLRAAIVKELAGRSLDVTELQRSRHLLLLDAEDTLATFMTEGRPDAHTFNDQMCRVIERVCRDRTACTVRIFGQMVDVLWQEGEREAAIRLEVLWNELAQTKAFSLLCGYAMGNFFKDTRFEEICGQHSHMVSADGSATRVASVAHDTDRRRGEIRGRR